MNGADADRICAKLDKLVEKHDETRLEFAEMRGEVTAKIKGLGVSVRRLDDRLTEHEKNGQERATKTAERLTALETAQQHCANPDTSGPRPAMPSDISAELARVSQLPQAEPRGLSIPPSLAKHGKTIKLAGLGGAGGIGFLLLVLAALGDKGIELVKALAQLLH